MGEISHTPLPGEGGSSGASGVGEQTGPHQKSALRFPESWSNYKLLSKVGTGFLHPAINHLSGKS